MTGNLIVITYIAEDGEKVIVKFGIDERYFARRRADELDSMWLSWTANRYDF